MEELSKEQLTIHEKLLAIQTSLKAPKDLFNSFGKYKYRSLEAILEAVKPYLREYKCTLRLKDEIVQIGERFYVKSYAILSDGKEEITNSAFAREAEKKSGMDESQITGSSSTYARKYCLNGLFAIDDTKDADTDEQANDTKEKQNIEEKAKFNKSKNAISSDLKKETTNQQMITKMKNIIALHKMITGEDINKHTEIEDLSKRRNVMLAEHKKIVVEKLSKEATEEHLQQISNLSIDKQYEFLKNKYYKGE